MSGLNGAIYDVVPVPVDERDFADDDDPGAELFDDPYAEREPFDMDDDCDENVDYLNDGPLEGGAE
jgi:hypothetical protein